MTSTDLLFGCPIINFALERSLSTPGEHNPFLIYEYACIYVYMNVCIFTCRYLCVYVYITCTHISTYTYIHAYIRLHYAPFEKRRYILLQSKISNGVSKLKIHIPLIMIYTTKKNV